MVKKDDEDLCKIAVSAFVFAAIFLYVPAKLSAGALAKDRRQLSAEASWNDPTHRWSIASPDLPLAGLVATGLNGKPVDIAKQAGWKVVYFWSAGCPCVKACEEYTLKPLAAKYAGKVSFFAVAADAYDLNKQVADLKTATAAHKLPYAVLLDRDHIVAGGLGAQVTPEVFLINPENRVVYSGMPDDSKRYLKLTGKHAVTETYLSTALEQALAGKPVTRPRTELEGCLISW